MLIVCAQGTVLANGIIEERAGSKNKDDVENLLKEYEEIKKQVNFFLWIKKYSDAIPMLNRMHELKPKELMPLEYLGISYSYLPEEKPEFTNALFWLIEAEKHGSPNDMVYFNLARIYSQKGDIEKAETAINKVFALGFFDFELINRDKDLENFRTGSLWKGICDKYIQIEEQLRLYEKYISDEDVGRDINIILFFNEIINTLKELAPNIPVLQCRPMVSLAFSCLYILDFSSAKQNLFEAKDIYEKVLGNEHPEYAAILNKLGLLYVNTGDYELSESCYLKALAIYEKVFDKKHLDYALTLSYLGVLYRYMEDYEKAERYSQEALAINENVFVKESPNYANEDIDDTSISENIDTIKQDEETDSPQQYVEKTLLKVSALYEEKKYNEAVDLLHKNEIYFLMTGTDSYTIFINKICSLYYLYED